MSISNYSGAPNRVIEESPPVRETPVERGMALAQATERTRVKSVLEGALSDVKRTALKKSVNQQSRDAYDRAFNRLEVAAQNWADNTGEEVSIPVRDAPLPLPYELHVWARELAVALEKHKIKVPALPTPATVQFIKPQGAPDGRYRESLGLSPDGSGLPLRGPGSNTDPDWVQK